MVKGFDAAGDEVVSFGERTMKAFAFGLEQGFRAISAIMRNLGGLLSYWLEPHSPPRVAPNLDTWGTQSANVWLEGWTRADFGILSKLGGMMQDFLGSLVAEGDLSGELNVIEQTIGTRHLSRRLSHRFESLGRFHRLPSTASALRRGRHPAL